MQRSHVRWAMALAALAILVWALGSLQSKHQEGVAAALPPLPQHLLQGGVLVIAPHPDDETLAAGGLIQTVEATGGHVCVDIVTDGDAFAASSALESGPRGLHPRGYRQLARRRQSEWQEAAARLGVAKRRRWRLGFPDRGIDALVRYYDGPAYRSPFTGRTHTSEGALAPGPLTGQTLVKALDRSISICKPRLVLLPSPFDTHRDHAATALFAEIALRHRRIAQRAYLVHYPSWPDPPGYHPQFSLTPPQRLREGAQWQALALDAAQTGRKKSALDAYPTQRRVIGAFLLSFVRRLEPFDATEAPRAKRGTEVRMRPPAQSSFIALRLQPGSKSLRFKVQTKTAIRDLDADLLTMKHGSLTRRTLHATRGNALSRHTFTVTAPLPLRPEPLWIRFRARGASTLATPYYMIRPSC